MVVHTGRLFECLTTILLGDDHKRQRKVLLPGFGTLESKAFLSIFKGCAASVSPCTPTPARPFQSYLRCRCARNGWRSSREVVTRKLSLISQLGSPAEHWMQLAKVRLCFHPIRIPFNFPSAAFDVQFGTTQNDEHPLASKYNNMMSVLLADLLLGP